MERARNFDEQNYDKLIVDYIQETLREKRLVGKILTNCQSFIKFITADFFTVNSIAV